VTALTTSTSAAQSEQDMSEGVREASELRHAVAQFAASGRPLSSVGHQAPATGDQSGRTLVPLPRPVPVSAVISDGSATNLVATRSHLSPQAGRAEPGARPDSSDHGEPVSAAAGEAGREWSAEAYVEALDGAERKILLDHIARAWPEVVEAGTVLVARWRAECAKQRRENEKRRRREQRRRQRAAGGRQS
jgi:hypothetical protein